MTAKPCNRTWLFTTGLACGLTFGPAFGKGARQPQNPALEKSKVIDLDFTDDDGEFAASIPPARTAGNTGSRQWIYWTVGVSVLAGGVGWYFLEERQNDQLVTRNEQVFTDERL
ncbi:MAG: hypothetical protein ABIW76_19790 [Fibrobacteria bacterium]